MTKKTKLTSHNYWWTLGSKQLYHRGGYSSHNQFPNIPWIVCQAPGIWWWDTGNRVSRSDVAGTFIKFPWCCLGIFWCINLRDFCPTTLPSPSVCPALCPREQSEKSHLLPWEGVTQQNQSTKSHISESESQQPIHSLRTSQEKQSVCGLLAKERREGSRGAGVPSRTVATTKIWASGT